MIIFPSFAYWIAIQWRWRGKQGERARLLPHWVKLVPSWTLSKQKCTSHTPEQLVHFNIPGQDRESPSSTKNLAWIILNKSFNKVFSFQKNRAVNSVCVAGSGSQAFCGTSGDLFSMQRKFPFHLILFLPAVHNPPAVIHAQRVGSLFKLVRELELLMSEW